MSARSVASLLLTALAASFTAPVHAALVQLCGTTICYEYDNDAAANPGVTLLGTPTLLGNSNVLKFTPGTMNVFTTGAANTADLNWSFHLTRVWSPQGLEIGPISLLVAGDYQIPVGGTVRADFALRAQDAVADGGLPGFPESVDWAGSFNESIPTGLPFRNWDLTGGLNPAAAFADLASSVSLTIVGHLSVTAGGPEQSGLHGPEAGPAGGGHRGASPWRRVAHGHRTGRTAASGPTAVSPPGACA